MNGEPRDPSTAAEIGNTVNRSTASIPVDLPLLQPVNTDGVTQMTQTKEDVRLTPLFTREAAIDFRSRWDLVQRSFVDDPKEAVHAADELVAQVTQNLAETFANQRSELEKGLDGAEATTTENLRIALRHYRSYFERLLSI
jgi:hypothetical protein